MARQSARMRPLRKRSPRPPANSWRHRRRDAMSIILMRAVWELFTRGGSEKLVLLALADWADDDGASLYPSMAAIARKASMSVCQARRIVRGLIDEGLLEVVANAAGGRA